MKICPYCNNEFDGGRSFGGHITNCKKNPKYTEIKNKISFSRTLDRKIHKLHCIKCENEYEIEVTDNDYYKGKYKKYCNIKCANSHIRTDESKLNISNIIKEKIKKGEIIIKEKNIKIKKLKKRNFCKNCNKEILLTNKSGFCKKCLSSSKDYRKKLSDNNKGKTGGYREKGGRGKQGWFKGFYCNSSWELAYVIYCLENDIKIKRNKEGFEYIFENKKYKFYPDFIKEDGSYVEVKGYLDNKNKSKLNQFNLEIELIDKNKIQLYLCYVIEKYGENFIELYNDNMRM